ncbi:MAG: hypothetical protein NVS3B12_27610 [Acidimicrobiales bacterium]
MVELAPEGALRFTETAFEGAKMALFNGGEQVSDWHPYVWNDMTGIQVAGPVTHITVRGREGTFVEFAVADVLVGDSVAPPRQPWVVIA